MTGLEKILAQIQEDANEAARQQLDDANQQAAVLEAETEALVQSKQATHTAHLDALRKDKLARATSAADLEYKKALLQKKQALMQGTIDAALEQLKTLPTEEYFALLLTLVKKYKGDSKATMVLSKSDLDRLPSTFATTLPKDIVLSDTPTSIQNGFVLLYDGIDLNCSFEALFADQAELLQDTVASILFE